MKPSAIVDGRITLSGLPQKTFERLRLAFSLPNPEFVTKQRYGGYTGDTPETIDIADETPEGDLRLPRGSIQRIKEQIEKDGVKLVFEDRRVLGKPIENVFKPPLRFYQQEAADQILKHPQGVVVLPCAGGKTRTGLGVVAAVSRTTLVLVPNDELLDQWVGHAGNDKEGPCGCIGLLGIVPGVLNAAKKEVDADVVIATTQSALAWATAHPGWTERFGLVIVDEAHRVASYTYTKLMMAIPAKYRLALTATPFRTDGLGILIEWSFGNTLVKYTVDELAKAGFLVKPEIRFVQSPVKIPHDPLDPRPLAKQLTSLHRELVASTERNAFLVRLIADEIAKGEVVLVLANNKTMCSTLVDCLKILDVECELLTGAVSKRKRKGHVEAMRQGNLPCIIATSVADEGLDLPRISRIVLAFPESAKGRTTQRVGRLMRTFPGKKPVLIDVVDNHPTLARRAGGRKRTYRELGLIQ